AVGGKPTDVCSAWRLYAIPALLERFRSEYFEEGVLISIGATKEKVAQTREARLYDLLVILTKELRAKRFKPVRCAYQVPESIAFLDELLVYTSKSGLAGDIMDLKRDSGPEGVSAIVPEKIFSEFRWDK